MSDEDTPVRTMLDLSTAHAPNQHPDFGEVRYVAHAEGWVVFCPGKEYEAHAPDWLKPILDYAHNCSCLLVNFDSSADYYPFLFPVWDW